MSNMPRPQQSPATSQRPASADRVTLGAHHTGWQGFSLPEPVRAAGISGGAWKPPSTSTRLFRRHVSSHSSATSPLCRALISCGGEAQRRNPNPRRRTRRVLVLAIYISRTVSADDAALLQDSSSWEGSFKSDARSRPAAILKRRCHEAHDKIV